MNHRWANFWIHEQFGYHRSYTIIIIIIYIYIQQQLEYPIKCKLVNFRAEGVIIILVLTH